MFQIQNEIDLANAALMRISAGQISDFSEDTDLANIVVTVFPSIIDSLLTQYDWQHLRKTVPLQRLAEVPVNGWKYAFAWPVGAITVVRRLLSDATRRESIVRDFAVEGRTIYSNEQALWGVFGFRLSPDQWLPALREGAVAALAAAFCVPVTENLEQAQMLRAEAFGTPQMNGSGGLIGAAIAMDHAQANARVPSSAAAHYWMD